MQAATAPGTCDKEDCSKPAVFMKNRCWRHLDPTDKRAYRDELLRHLCSGKPVPGQSCFDEVDVSDAKFPDFVVLRDCHFCGTILKRVVLRHADLRGSRFIGAILCDAHLEHCDLRGITTALTGSDLRGTDLTGASLQNVDCTDVDFRDATLIDVDLIGAWLKGTRLYATRLLNTRLRKENFCNFERTRASAITLADERDADSERPSYREAQLVYAALKNNFRSLGEYDDASWAHLKERSMDRKRLFRLACFGDRNADMLALEHWRLEEAQKKGESRLRGALNWIASWAFWLLGYGEQPSRVAAVSLVIIGLFGAAMKTAATGDLSWPDSLSLSVISFTTLGFVPPDPHVGTGPIVGKMMAFEALIGAFLMAAFAGLVTRRAFRG